jgi:hypothetical protein
MEKLPSKSDVVPVLVPSTVIVAPGRGPFESLTDPVIVFCALTLIIAKRNNEDKSIDSLLFFIISCLYIIINLKKQDIKIR